jgi:hypothetical protein
MDSWSVACPGFFSIKDEKENKDYCGCGQGWYRKKWQKMAGCGPTTAANIVLYMDRDKAGEKGLTIGVCRLKMEEMWGFVKPGLQGVNSTEKFRKGISEYASSKGMELDSEVCDIPEERSGRPELGTVLGFIEEALDRDCPVAFLNLCNGMELSLHKWHWVTIIGLEHDGDDGSAMIEVLDEGSLKRLNLALWYDTTKKGGGFVYCTNRSL